jgi:putrescine importer
MRPKLTAVVGGYQPFAPFGVVLLVSSLACGLAGHLGAVRLLYGMGGDNLLPRRIFGHLDVERGNPSDNVAMVASRVYRYADYQLERG